MSPLPIDLFTITGLTKKKIHYLFLPFCDLLFFTFIPISVNLGFTYSSQKDTTCSKGRSIEEESVLMQNEISWAHTFLSGHKS